MLSLVKRLVARESHQKADHRQSLLEQESFRDTTVSTGTDTQQPV